MDLTLMVLVDPKRLPRDRVGDFSAAVKAGGATLLQLRGKDLDGAELVRYGRHLRRATQLHGLSLTVDDRVDVALVIDADGVHVGQSDIRVADVHRLAPDLKVGLSISSREELESVEPHGVPDYFGIGPVYPTPSKPDAKPPLGLDGLRDLVRRAGTIAPSVAIGGITIARAGEVWDAGVRGLAVISAVVEAPDWVLACRGLLRAKGE